FQAAHGLTVDAIVGAQTRKALYLAYMDALCGPRLTLDKEANFLARHRDGHGLKGDVQGCGEFNPMLVFSKEESTRLASTEDKTERNRRNAPNRRIMVLLFAPGRRVNPARWRCPRVREGASTCRTRFFLDGETRRAPQAEERKFEETGDTFACRFYQVISDDSPCERFLRSFRIRLFDHAGALLPGAPFAATTGGVRFTGVSDSNGDAVIRDVAVPATCLIAWNRPPVSTKTPSPGAGFEFELNVFLDVPRSEGTEPSGPMPVSDGRKRLNNLGYAMSDNLEENVMAFQLDCGVPQTGRLGDIEDRLRQQHDVVVAPPTPPSHLDKLIGAASS